MTLPTKYTIGFEIHIKIDEVKLFCTCLESFNANDSFYNNRIYNKRTKTYNTFRYNYDKRTCDYELEESLPNLVNSKSLSIAKSVAKEYNMNLLPYYTVYRKEIYDGSLPTGFQRTGVIGINGMYKNIKITELRLEEDSCKKIKEEFHVCRLGTPLLQLVTEPIIIENKKDVEDTFKYLFDITSVVRKYTKVRGLGTIRQDVNIHAGLGKTELKGLQDIKHNYESIILKEVLRQNKIIKNKILYYKPETYTIYFGKPCIKLFFEEVLNQLNVTKFEIYKNRIQLVPLINFKHNQLISLINSIRTKSFQSTRKANKKNNNTKYLRGSQSKSRYTTECLIEPVNLDTVDLAKELLEYKPLCPYFYNQLNTFIEDVKKELDKKLDKYNKKYNFTSDEIDYLAKNLLNRSLEELIKEMYPPFHKRILSKNDINVEDDLKSNLYRLSHKYKKNIDNYVYFKQIIEQMYIILKTSKYE
jgi:Glu-tRNA(Gln) amidotransferase subunit E-like FAD-binding protein